jgi:hypothetical protein
MGADGEARSQAWTLDSVERDEAVVSVLAGVVDGEVLRGLIGSTDLWPDADVGWHESVG